MTKISTIELAGHKRLKQAARELLAAEYSAEDRCGRFGGLLKNLETTSIGMLDRKVKHGEDLTFEEAFAGMCYVLAATNRHLYERFKPLIEKSGADFAPDRALALAVAFLSGMAMKESLSQLTSDEIAGMVAAAMMDTVVAFKADRIIETCGMGGDKGFGANGTARKSINASTLSAITLAALGLPAVKHGSYGNTSAVGSTETIELFGALTSMESAGEAERIWRSSGFCFFDAHWSKTIHDLSHLLMMETINHVIGPMTPPFTKDTEINKLMGVNEKVHPADVALAYAELHRRGIQKVGGVLVIAGVDQYVDPGDHAEVRAHTVTDEVSPYGTVVAAAYQGEFLGNYFLRPEDFGITLDSSRIQVRNNRADIHAANIAALQGNDPNLAAYLAMNAALGLYAYEYLPKDCMRADGVSDILDEKHLQECLERCREAIMSGAAERLLSDYVRASGGIPAFAVSAS
ncbi:MAG TPA: hypothetical protein VFT82_01585 [Candidatus Paceibacterota bacterium]|nr:hypothetical protein [Candidatus Paceibacterota bacterium]